MASAYTNFACRAGGSNLNSGSRTGSTTVPGTTADFTYSSGTWVAATGVFTVASGAPDSDGVAVGDWASVYANGSTATGFIGRVTARTSTTITVSLTAKGGTAPVDGTNTRTLKIGGAWLGPNGATPWFDTVPATTMTNVAGDTPKIWMMNDATYSITSTCTFGSGDIVNIEGFASTYGDGGRAVIDGGTSGASYSLWTLSASAIQARIANLEFRNNGATGSVAGVSNTITAEFYRCVIRDIRGHGITLSGHTAMIECEVYGANQANAATQANVNSTASLILLRCFIHRSNTTNTSGVRQSALHPVTLDRCVIEGNGANGGLLIVNASTVAVVRNCDFFNNVGPGINCIGRLRVENSNFLLNAGYAIVGPTADKVAVVVNCGFGRGTMVNTPADTSGFVEESGSVAYASNAEPWTDRTTGDYSLVDPLAIDGGYGGFLQTASGHGSTIAHLDIGAAQHEDAGGSGGLIGGGNLSGGLQ